jgi:hypothetical protein
MTILDYDTSLLWFVVEQRGMPSIADDLEEIIVGAQKKAKKANSHNDIMITKEQTLKECISF